MALTRTVTHGAGINTAAATTVVTHTITATSLVVAIFQAADNQTATTDAATPMTVSGAAMTWTKVAETTAGTGSTMCVTRIYAAISNGAGSRTFTHTKANATAFERRLSIYAFEGAPITVAAAIPSGNRFVGSTPAANVSRAITPASTGGSMILGAIGDWAQTNTFAALSSNTLSNTINTAGQYTGVMVEPTTSPLAGGTAFTWGANTTGGSCTYAVVEIVQALPVTITGVSTAVAPVGPFKSSGGNYYFFGRDGTTATTLQAYKTIAPFSYVIAAGINTSNLLGSSAANSGRYQTFTTGTGVTLVNSVVFGLTKAGSPTDNLTVGIYLFDTGTSLPTGSSLGTSAAIVGSTLTTTATRYTFTFSTPVSLSANTKYAAVITRSAAADSVNRYALFSGTVSNTDTDQGSGTYSPTGGTWGALSTTDMDLTVSGTVSTGPDASWASVATKTGFATGIQYISAYQVGDVIHMCITDGATTSINHKYQTFDATTDTFVTAETINLALNTQTSASANAYGTSIVVRAGGTPPEVVVHYQAARISTFAQTAYRRRTGIATWAAGVAVSTTGVNAINPFVVLGASDRLHFLWFNSTNTIQRHLTSANVLGTAASTGATATVQDVITIASGTPNFIGLTATSAFRWASADNPTVTNAAVTLGTPVRGADANSVSYALYQSSTDSDLYIKTSSDNGATWGTAISEFAGTVASADANLSKNQAIYTRGSATVFPYIVNDNGTLKYDEYPLTTVTNYTLPADTGTLTLAGQAATLARSRVMPADVGTLTLAGQDVTLTKAAGAVHRTMPADVGTLTLAGQAVTLKRTRVMSATVGALTLAGQPAALRVARKVVADTGALTLAGQPVILRVTMPAALGTLTLAGQAVTLRYTRIMPAALGTVTLAGAAPNLVYSGAGSKSMPAGLGTITLAGQTVTLRYAHKLIANVGTLTLAGQATGLRASHAPLTATLGTITLAGQLVTTRFAHRTVAGLGTLTLAGQTAITRFAHKLPAGVGALTLGGQNVTLRFSHKTPAGLGTITLAGPAVNLIYSGAGNKLLPAGLGTLTLGGQPVTLRCSRKMPATLSTITLAGQTVALHRGRKITVDPRAIVLEGKAVGLNYRSPARLIAETGVLSLAGCDVTLPVTRRPPTIVQENLKFGRSVYVSRW